MEESVGGKLMLNQIEKYPMVLLLSKSLNGVDLARTYSQDSYVVRKIRILKLNSRRASKPFFSILLPEICRIGNA